MFDVRIQDSSRYSHIMIYFGLKTMEQIAQKSQATALAANHSQADLMQMSLAMRELAVATTSISSTLGMMNEKANNINSVVTTITKVADQTNLLSLNAYAVVKRIPKASVGGRGAHAPSGSAESDTTF